MDDVVNDVTPLPPANTEPPLDAAYQSSVVPDGAVAEIITVPELQTEPPTAPVGAVGKAFIVAITAVLEEDIQPEVLFLASA